MPSTQTYDWYQQLIKPFWAPPGWLFGPVWIVLYFLIAISFSRVVFLFVHKQISFLVVLPFVLNLIFNIAFTPIQFGLHNNFLAALDISLVVITLIWAMIAIYPYQKWITFFQIPYLAWVLFATVLQFSITLLNM